MTSDRDLLERVRSYQEQFGLGVKCNKFLGAVTVEVLRAALREAGLLVAERDVFIRGVPVEVDLLILRPGTDTIGRLLYESSEVIAALEIKNRGSFGKSTVQRVHATFLRFSGAVPGIHCAYVTLSERKGYGWAITDDNIGDPHRAFTLFRREGAVGDCDSPISTGQWCQLLQTLQSWVYESRRAGDKS